MKIDQIAQAVINDPTANNTRARALKNFTHEGHWDSAVNLLLVTVYAEMKKPIYEGVHFDGSAWQAAALILESEINRAIEAKQGA